MIWITGDMHGDFSCFSERKIRNLRKTDILLVCGDFGFVWDGSDKEKKLLEKIGKLRVPVCFADGAHENFSLLEQYPVTEKWGGRVRVISGRLCQLMRGEVYDMDGVSVFAFGGGEGDDEDFITPDPRRQPTEEEMARGIRNLEKAGNRVDLIVTHDAPTSIRDFVRMKDNECSLINTYLEEISRRTEYKGWCFGRYHLDKMYTPRHRALYNSLLPASEFLPELKKERRFFGRR